MANSEHFLERCIGGGVIVTVVVRCLLDDLDARGFSAQSPHLEAWGHLAVSTDHCFIYIWLLL